MQSVRIMQSHPLRPSLAAPRTPRLHAAAAASIKETEEQNRNHIKKKPKREGSSCGAPWLAGQCRRVNTVCGGGGGGHFAYKHEIIRNCGGGRAQEELGSSTEVIPAILLSLAATHRRATRHATPRDPRNTTACLSLFLAQYSRYW